jgi:hypothetical protein
LESDTAKGKASYVKNGERVYEKLPWGATRLSWGASRHISDGTDDERTPTPGGACPWHCNVRQ